MASAEDGSFLRGVVALDDAALARHDGVACSEVAPPGRDREIVHQSCYVRRRWRGRRLWRPPGAIHLGSRPALGCRGREGRASSRPRAAEAASDSAAPAGISVGPAWQRDARPFHSECPCIRLAIAGVVQGGEDVMKQIFRARSYIVEIPACGYGQIRTTSYSFAANSKAIVTKIDGEHVGTAFNQVQTRHLLCNTSLRWLGSFLRCGTADSHLFPSNTCGR